ncbi:AarF/UbiB family protein [Streptosporangium sp. NPDC023825]|uniref:ABC1 kinase family protein n=1 Tax=Streptosporangium sp. NPDC023825 TaxID=3154909 RepID=UPI00343FF04C
MIGVLVLVTAFTVAARRLLDLRSGIVRTLLAGTFVVLIAGPLMKAFAGAVAPDDPGVTPIWFFILAVVCALLAGLVPLVIAEALIPSGSLPGPRPRRALQQGPAGGSLREALDDGGVTFVKLGQILSTRSDLLAVEFVEELRLLQDGAASAPWTEIEPVLVAELGGPVEETFADFDREPLAAASIAQVYRARLRTGEEVVVKVQRPGIAGVVEQDLDIIDRLAHSLERRTRWGRAFGVTALSGGFADALREELDFRSTARCATRWGACSARWTGGTRSG